MSDLRDDGDFIGVLRNIVIIILIIIIALNTPNILAFVCGVITEIAFGGWPVIVFLAILTVGIFLLYARRNGRLSRVVGKDCIAFSSGMLPQVCFLILYNSHAVGYLDNGSNFTTEPHLFPLANQYEKTMLAMANLLDGWREYLFIAICTALIVLLSLWRAEAGRGAARASAAFGVFNMFLCGAVALTVLSRVPVRDWSPDYTGKLRAKLADEDKHEAYGLLLEKLKIQFLPKIPDLTLVYGATIQNIAIVLDPGPAPFRRDLSSLNNEDRDKAWSEDSFAQEVHTDLSSEFRGQSYDLAKEYAEITHAAILETAKPVEFGSSPPDLAPVRIEHADRPSVIQMDNRRKAVLEKIRLAKTECVSALAEFFWGLSSTLPRVRGTLIWVW